MWSQPCEPRDLNDRCSVSNRQISLPHQPFRAPCQREFFSIFDVYGSLALSADRQGWAHPSTSMTRYRSFLSLRPKVATRR